MSSVVMQKLRRSIFSPVGSWKLFFPLPSAVALSERETERQEKERSISHGNVSLVQIAINSVYHEAVRSGFMGGYG